MDSADTDAIVGPIRAYFSALNAGDLEALLALFTEMAAVVPNEAEAAVGIEAVRALYEHRFGLIEYQRELQLDEVFSDGDVAVVRCHTTGSFTSKIDGERTVSISRELFALERIDGQWKIRSYLFNRTTAAAS